MIETIIKHITVPEHMILKDKYFFLHIPKTAGTSLKFLLMEQFHRDDIFPSQTSEQMEDIDEEDIPKYKLYIGHHRYQFVDYFAPFRPRLMTMLRDPIDRVLSDYYFARTRPDVDLYISECPTFDDYLTHPHTQNRIFNNQSQHLLGVRYGDLVELDLDDCYDVITQRLDDMEFVGITEHFAESLALLADTFDWRISKEIHRNVSNRRRDAHEITRQQIETIRQKNDLDLRVYSYAKDLFQRRLYQLSQTTIHVNNYQHYLSQLTYQDSYIIDFAKDVLLGDGWGVRLANGRDLPVNTDIRFHLALRKSIDFRLRFYVTHATSESMLDQLQLQVNGTNIPLELTKKTGKGWDYKAFIPVHAIGDDQPTEFHLRLDCPDFTHTADEEPAVTLRRLFIKPIKQAASKESNPQALAELRSKFDEFQQLYVLEDSYYFLHIQKTAGTSLRALLASKFHRGDIFPSNLSSELDTLPNDKIINYKLYMGHHRWEFIEHFSPNRPQVMTLLRNPINRVVSQYYFNRNDQFPEVLACQTLQDYVNHPNLRGYTNNFQSRNIMGPDFRKLTQLSLSDQIDIVTQRLSAFEFVGITERFADAMMMLDHVFGWMPSEEVRRNVTEKRPKVTDHDETVIETIRLKNQLDIAVYEYAKDLFNTRFRQLSQLLIQSHNHQQYLTQIHDYTDEIELQFDNDVIYGTGWIVTSPRGRDIPANTDVHVYLPLKSSTDLIMRLFVGVPDSASLLDSFDIQIGEYPVHLELSDTQGDLWATEGQIPYTVIAEGQPTCVTLRLNVDDDSTMVLSLRRVSISPVETHFDSTFSIDAPLSIEQLEEQLNETTLRASQLEETLQSQAVDLDRLAIIEQSWSWNLILKLNRIRLLFIPRDSRRERWYIALRDRIVGHS